MKRTSLTIITLMILATMLAATPVPAEEKVLTVGRFEMGEKPKEYWKLEVKEGDPVYKMVQEDGFVALNMKTDRSSFGFTRKFSPKINVKERPFLNWRWKVATLPKGGDFRKKIYI